MPKFVKAFKRAYDAVTAFGEKLKWANRVLEQADETAEAAAAAAAKAADDAAAAKSADDAAGATGASRTSKYEN